MSLDGALGFPLAIVAGLLALAATIERLAADRSRAVPFAAAGLAAGCATCFSLTSTDLTAAAMWASLAAIAAWLACRTDPRATRTGGRGIAAFALVCLIGDAAVVLSSAIANPAIVQPVLFIAFCARGRVVPMNGFGIELSRLPGASYVLGSMLAQIGGIGYLIRAVVGHDAPTGTGLVIAVLAVLVALAASLLARRFRMAVDVGIGVELALVAAGLSLGSPVGVVGAILVAFGSIPAWAAIALAADSAHPHGAQTRRVPGALGVLPGAIGLFCTLGIPPSAAFLGRWFLLLALIEAAEPGVLVIVVCAPIVIAAAIVRHASGLALPRDANKPSERVAVTAALLWIPLVLGILPAIALIIGPVGDAAAAAFPSVAWDLGYDRLFGVPGALALALTCAIPLGGIALARARDIGLARRSIFLWRDVAPGGGSEIGRNLVLQGLPWIFARPLLIAAGDAIARPLASLERVPAHVLIVMLLGVLAILATW
ncbi:MAG: hypothetical protein FJ033_01235 [Chloroflexi bacterium]|nr:hypothetical protein [Chloroflexota bacterium]